MSLVILPSSILPLELWVKSPLAFSWPFPLPPPLKKRPSFTSSRYSTAFLSNPRSGVPLAWQPFSFLQRPWRPFTGDSAGSWLGRAGLVAGSVVEKGSKGRRQDYFNHPVHHWHQYQMRDNFSTKSKVAKASNKSTVSAGWPDLQFSFLVCSKLEYKGILTGYCDLWSKWKLKFLASHFVTWKLE